MKKILSIILLICTFITNAQNLVPNGSFENYTNCPTNPAQIYLTFPWFQPRYYAGIDGSSTDLFNTCNNSVVSVPSNVGGYQNARTGNGYAGFYGGIDTLDYREYIEVPLDVALDTNKQYCVEFYVSLADKMQFAISNIGAYFSTDSLLDTAYSGYHALDYITPQIENPTIAILNDTTNWMLISGIYTASGGETFMTIGNFHNAANTNSQNLPWGSFNGAYYYLDDVSVTQCNMGVNEVTEDISISVYPNPSNGEFIIKSTSKIENIKLFNVLGETIYQTTKDNLQSSINLSYQSKGIYFVQVKTEKGILNRKVVIQ